MNRLLAIPFLTALLAASPHTLQRREPTPAPLPASNFSIPLADGQTATAAILPTRDGQAFFVYSTPTGQLGSYLMTPTTSPAPQPNPQPQPQPTPPPTPTATALLFVTVTESTPAAIGPELQQWLDANKSKAICLTVAQVAKPDTPPEALSWIGATAGHPYPYAFIADQTGRTLWHGQPPADAAAMIALLASHLAPAATRTPTPLPFCPTCPLR